jgi:hypothetical protein
MNVAVGIGGDNEEVAVAGVTLVSVSDEKTHDGDRYGILKGPYWK